MINREQFMPADIGLLSQRVNRMIAAGDGMYSPTSERHYFAVGESAIENIFNALDIARRPPTSVRNVLDYACGYGRVLRWLKVAFPDATLLGVDADPKAANGAEMVLNVPTRPLDVTLASPVPGGKFDLVWIGSLFTHLRATETARVIRFLAEQLEPGGLIVFTTHGHLVANRLSSRERLYNLSEQDAESLLRELHTTNYGFSPYNGMLDYGISVAHPKALFDMAMDAKLEPILFVAAGWASHQDVFAFRRAK
jgi:SAM-dependent methyltransferase